MVKLIALYKHPDDQEAFDRHYNEVHTPLVQKMPGLKKLEVTRMYGSPAGESPYYLQAEMHFESKDALNAALQSEEGKASAKDVMSFAGKLVTMMYGEVVDE